MKKVRISIIVPIYKVEKYLRQCLDSICNQTYNNLEIILVDDGSPDKCGEICDEYSKKDSRIKVIHKVNGGVSSARNEGIKNSTGKYIMFLDADDILYDGIINKICSRIKEDIDMYTFNFSKIAEDGNQIIENVTNEIEDGIYDKKSFLKINYDNYRTFPWNVWQSVYKADIIKKNDIKFPIGIKAAEDTDFYITYLKYIEQIKYSKELIIKYRINREASAMSAMNTKSLLNIFEIYSKYFYGDDKFLSKYFAEFYVVGFVYIARIKDKEEREKVIDAIDSNIVKNVKGFKFGIFKIMYFILGKERAINLLLRIKKLI